MFSQILRTTTRISMDRGSDPEYFSRPYQYFAQTFQIPTLNYACKDANRVHDCRRSERKRLSDKVEPSAFNEREST